MDEMPTVLTLDQVETEGSVDVESELLGIGQLAAMSGLSVSALRFYDGADVLRPAAVDPHSGYRRYHPEQRVAAQVLARLRRVGMPLADIRRVLADPAAGAVVLERHLRRLEDGLTDARHELSAVHALLRPEENVMPIISLPASELLAGLSAVRHAVGSDPELPVLHGVFFEATEDQLRLTATDRYRLASCGLPASGPAGSALSVVVPTALVDEALTLLAGDTGPVMISAHDGTVELRAAAGTVTGAEIALAFPDVDRLLRLRTPRAVTVGGRSLRDAVRSGGTRPMTRDQDGAAYPVTVLALDDAGAVTVLAAEAEPGPDDIGVNQEFLLQALEVSDHGQLTLELDGPIGPLAIRGGNRLCVVMPTRLGA